jgi:hypothetical protein
MPKERNQNLVIGDTTSLRLFTYNSNHRQNVSSIEKVEIFYLDDYSRTEDNPEGRVLLQTIDSADITLVEDNLGGQYSVNVFLETDRFSIGNYLDVWHVNFNNFQSGTVTNEFSVIPDLWFASDMPIIYDFSFGFRPNRIKYGERRWINIEITPNVPNIADLKRYYVNLAISSPLKIYVEKTCGDCLPKEKDLRIVVDGETVEHRRGAEGNYFLDTESLDMTVGIYNVWFEMEFGESKYISENLQLEVY